jgi:TRAP-type C4-dicarboxylate transport system permease small subunit
VSSPAQAGVRPSGAAGLLLRAYDVWLARVEQLLLGLLLAVVILLSFVEILNRNFGWQLWDSSATARITYAFTFYVGLFGAVAASRTLQHIRIDAITPYVKPRTRAALDALSAAIGCAACIGLALATHTYLTKIVDPTDRFMPQYPEWYWTARVWHRPIEVAFGWMAVHFAVGAVRAARKAASGELGEQEEAT